jgi:hypothetical protein
MSCVHCSASKTAYRCASAYRNARSIAIGNNQNISFSEPLSPPAHACTANFCVLFFYRPTGRPRRNSLPLECHRNGAINRTRSFQARGICGGQSSGVIVRVLWHSSNPSARSLSRSPSSPPPSFRQNLPLPRVHECVMGRLVHTGLGPSSLVAHDLHYPPPPREQLCNRYCSDKHTHSHSKKRTIRYSFRWVSQTRKQASVKAQKSLAWMQK